MTECKICGKDYKRLDVHVSKSHGLTQDEYDELDVSQIDTEPEEETEQVEIPEDMTEEEAKAIVKGQEQIDNIFKDSVDTGEIPPEDEPLSTILAEFNLTYKELRSIIKAYTGGDPIDVTQTIERNQRVGVDGASKLKDLKETSTTNLNVAEELEKVHGFVVTEVKGSPKTWYLQKQ